jgi:hypothetical protein
MTLAVYSSFVHQTMHDDNPNEAKIKCNEPNNNATTYKGESIQLSSNNEPLIPSPSRKLPNIMNAVLVEQQAESQAVTLSETSHMTMNSDFGLNPDRQNRNVTGDNNNGIERVHDDIKERAFRTDTVVSQSNSTANPDGNFLTATDTSLSKTIQEVDEIRVPLGGSSSMISPNHVITVGNNLNQIENRHQGDRSDVDGLDQVSRDAPPQKPLVAIRNENVTIASVPAAHVISKSLLINHSASTFNPQQSSFTQNIVVDISKKQQSASNAAPIIDHTTLQTSNSVSPLKTGNTNSELSFSESLVNIGSSAHPDLQQTNTGNRFLPSSLTAHTISDKYWKKLTPTIAKKVFESQDTIPIIDEKLVQDRRPLTDLYGPFLCHTTDASLQIARDRLQKAIRQTYALRKAFTDRVYTKYRVCLQPALPPDHVVAAILTDPKASDERLTTETAWIRDEKEIEKKETMVLNAEMSASKEKKEELGNIDNAEQLMYFTAGLNLVILPEAELPPEHLQIYSERCPINPITGHRVRDISQAAAIAGEVIIDRARKAATMRNDRTKEQTTSSMINSNAPAMLHRLPELANKGLTTVPISLLAPNTRIPVKAKVDSRLIAINPHHEYDSVVKVPRIRHPALSISIPSLISLNPIFDELKSNSTKPGAATSWLIANTPQAILPKSHLSRTKGDMSAGKRRLGNDSFDHRRILDILQNRHLLPPADSGCILPNIPIHENGLPRQPLDVLAPSAVVNHNHWSSSLASIITEFLVVDSSRTTALLAPKMGLLRKRKFTEEMQVQPPTVNLNQRFLFSVLAAPGLIRMTKPSDADNDTLLTPPVSKKLRPLLSESMLVTRSRLESSKLSVVKLVVPALEVNSQKQSFLVDDEGYTRGYITDPSTIGTEVDSQTFDSNVEKQQKRLKLDDAVFHFSNDSDNKESATNGVHCFIQPSHVDLDFNGTADLTIPYDSSLHNLPVLVDQQQQVLQPGGSMTTGHPPIKSGTSEFTPSSLQPQPLQKIAMNGNNKSGKSVLGSTDFAVPEAPSPLSDEHAMLIRLGQFHQVISLTSDMSMLSIALTYLRDVSHAIPISNDFIFPIVVQELGRHLSHNLVTDVIPIDIMVASVKSWLWSNHFRVSQFNTYKIEPTQEFRRIIVLAVNVAVKALVLESEESTTKCIGAFSEVYQAQKTRVAGKAMSDVIGPYCNQRLELCVATVVSAALSEKVFIDPLLNSLLPNLHDALKSLDDARLLAFRSKARERTLLASYLSRTSVVNETFSSAFVGSVVRAGEAFGHDQIFEEVQNEKAVASSMIPYDIFTEDNGLWETPSRPIDGFLPGLTGDELYNRAHARAELQMSLKKMQERHHILGGVTSQGPYGEADANQYVVAGESESAQEKTFNHSSSPRPSLKRRVSAIIESYFPPGTGSAAAKSASVYDPRHISVPLDWDSRSMSRTPYGVHSWSSRNRLSDRHTSETLVDPRVARPKTEPSLASGVTSKKTSHRGHFPSSTHEIAWADVAEVFHVVKLSKRSATTRNTCPSMINTADSKIYAPFFRPAGTIENDHESDSGMSNEDLSDETVLKNHQLILDKMREGLDRVSEARKRQQENRKNRQK